MVPLQNLQMEVVIDSPSLRWPRRAIYCYFHLEILQWNDAMEVLNGSAQWKCVYISSIISQSHFEFSYRGPSSRPARRIIKPAEAG